MTSTTRVYDDWVEARSFGCKRCGYTSTNRRVVEQHLRQMHADLFNLSPDPSPQGEGSREERDTPPANGRTTTLVPIGSSASSPPEPAEPSTTPQDLTPLPFREGGPGGLGLVLYTDAGTWDNGTKRQRSVLAVWDGRRRAIAVHEELPGTTNNEAEYAAIIAALELARHERLRGVLIRSDSQLCVNQINGAWQIKEQRLRPLRERAARLLGEIGGRIEWVPRERNHAGIFLEKTYKK